MFVHLCEYSYEDTCSSEHGNQICAINCVCRCGCLCALACICEHLSICAYLCDVMWMMCGSEAYLPPSYIICILVTACPLGVRFTDAYCVQLAALVFMESHCYGEVPVECCCFGRQTSHTHEDKEEHLFVYVRMHMCLRVCRYVALLPVKASCLGCQSIHAVSVHLTYCCE